MQCLEIETYVVCMKESLSHDNSNMNNYYLFYSISNEGNKHIGLLSANIYCFPISHHQHLFNFCRLSHMLPTGADEIKT